MSVVSTVDVSGLEQVTATRTTYWSKFGSYLDGLDTALRGGRYLPANRTHAVEIKRPSGFERAGASNPRVRRIYVELAASHRCEGDRG